MAAMKTTSAPPDSATPTSGAPAAQAPAPDLLNPEEFAALLAIDGKLGACRPSAATESRLRRLGLIAPSPLSRLPVRTPKGEALIAAAGLRAPGDGGP